MKKKRSSIFDPLEVPKKPGADKWAILQFVYDKDSLVVNYVDGLGKSNEGDKTILPAGRPLFKRSAATRKLEKYLSVLAKFHPLGKGPGKELPLNLYIECSDEILRREFVNNGKRILIRLFPGALTKTNFEWAFYNFQNSLSRPFALPLRVQSIGDRALDALIKVEKASFLDDVVGEYGLRIEKLYSLKGLKELDILVIDDEEARTIHFTEKIKPRLLIYVSRKYNRFRFETKFDYINCMIIENRSLRRTSEFIKSFFYEITHNHNLLTAVRLAKGRHQFHDEEAIVFASPVANESLRIEDALKEFMQKLENYASKVNPGRIDEFIKGQKGLGTLGRIFHKNKDLHYYFDRTRQFSSSFNQESSGMAPMAYQHREFSSKQLQLESLHGKLKHLVNDPRFFKTFREKQERRVNLSLYVLDWNLQYNRLGPNSIIRPGGRYKLNVNIGQPLPENLIRGENPPVDPLLPDPDNAKGHLLEAVVFPKDFILDSASVQVMQLPLLGASDTVQFFLKAPMKTGNACLRVALFHKNHLLQAFLLTTKVSRGYRSSDDQPGIVARLDLSTTKKFTNLDKLKKRDQYIGLNANSNGTHSIFLKGETAKEISGLNESVLKEVQEDFRKQMNESYFNDKNDPRFPLEKMPGDLQEFETTVRRLVRFGMKCYDQVFESNDPDVKKMLVNLRDKEDLNIQIGRLELNFSFPWNLVYDYILPDEATGQAPYPVCYGKKIEGTIPRHAIRPKGSGGCPHNPSLYTYCLHGFWSVRHRLEQLPITELAMDGEEKKFSKKMRSVLLCNNLTSTYTDKMEETLKKTNPDMFKADVNTNVLEMVFDDGQRPVNLVIVGHLEKETVPTDPPGERILTFPREKWKKDGTPIPAEKWILRRSILDFQKEGKLMQEPPLAIVFLISCCNAGMTVGSLGSLVRSFKSAGALAVVGTECDITPDLSARFVEEMMRYLYNEKLTLGSAIRRFNQSMVQDRIPLAFSFSCFGNNDIKLSN